MASLNPSMTAISPIPSPVTSANAHSSSSSISSSASESENERPMKSRLDRPKLAARIPSASNIIPRGRETQQRLTEYSPDDARAMSPRRESADLERLGREARQSLKDQAKTLQSSLQALADRIDEVKSDHDKLETENRFLQDYIGGLTRTISKGDMQTTSGVKGKK